MPLSSTMGLVCLHCDTRRQHQYRGRDVDDESGEAAGNTGAAERGGTEDEDVFAMENPTLTTAERVERVERFQRPYLSGSVPPS
jgi:hypothetical protein